MKALLDFIPLIAFFIVAKMYGVLEGAMAILVATVAVSLVHLVTQKGKLTKQQLIVLILTVLFCGLTILLQDDIYLKWKSTYINGIFAAALLVSIAVGKPLLKPAMKSMFNLEQSGWNKLTIAWAIYFVIMAGLQYYFAFHTSKQTWIAFKSYGWIPFMLVFMIGQFVILKDYLNPELTDDTDKNSNTDAKK